MSRVLKVGITVTETKSDRAMLELMVMAMSSNICPASSSMKTMGRNTARVVKVAARMAPQTSLAPS